MGNHRPSVGVGGRAFWRRLRLVPFEHTVANEDRIDNLHAMMVDAEGPAILAWIVQGAVDVAGWGLEEPAARVRAHDLRHTAASLAISAGANPKVVQRMLGHASAAMTLDVYADLFDSDLGTVAESVAKMWPPTPEGHTRSASKPG